MATAGCMNRSVLALGWWLIAVGAFRSAYTFSCFFGSTWLSSATFSAIHMTSVHGRTVGVWTLLSCTLCFMCAFNLDSKPVYMATFLSFFYAITYLGIECLIYHSIHFASLVPLSSSQGHPWFGCCFSGTPMVPMDPVPVGLQRSCDE